MSELPKPDEQPMPCPTCGKLPELKGRWFNEGGPYAPGRLLVMRWYECRRWFGLRLCRRGPSHTNAKDWGDLAQRCAAQKWNAALSKVSP